MTAGETVLHDVREIPERFAPIASGSLFATSWE